MSDTNLVWSSDQGDMRKKKSGGDGSGVNEADLTLRVRRLTSGKGRTVVEITGLPNHKTWCKKLAGELKKRLGVGGAYKNDCIEIHGEKLEGVAAVLEERGLKWKKTGG